MSKETQELLKQIKVLSENMDILTKVTAVNIGKEEIFKGKDKKEEKIEILDKMGLPRNIIAIITGSTPESVSSFKSMKKPRASKPKPQNLSEGVEKKNEQKTV
jgi:hypothetical protein